MTALALPLTSVPRLSWPRIGALSGTLSLHIYAVLLLLTPPVAMQLIRQAQEQPVVVTILDPPKKEEVKPVPPPPTPPQHQEAHPRPTPVMQPAHIETVITTTDNPMSYPATPESGPADIGPAREIAPTALAYGAAARHVTYPMDALRRREHGTVILRVLVGTDGNPQVVEIETSSGSPRLDKAARDAVLHWSFQPGTRNGVAQSAWAKVPIAFDLTTL